MTTNLQEIRTGKTLTTLRELYDDGKYLAAYQQGVAELGALEEWQGTEAQILAGRMAANLGAPWLSQRLHIRAYRHAPHHPMACYSFARVLMDRKGPLKTAQFLKKCVRVVNHPDMARAEWYALHALVYALLRDFDTSEQWFQRAEEADAKNPWIWVERSTILEQEDRYEEALAAARKSLEIRPWYRAGVQSVAHLLSLTGQDSESLSLLQEASENLESGVIALQLAYLQSEAGLYAEAETSLNRFLELSPLATLRPPTLQEIREEGEEEDEPLAAFRSDMAYQLGDVPRALALAKQVKGYFHEQLATRMENAAPDAKRQVLAVPFVRQHHVTCAPATLTAISRFWQKPADHLAVVEEICYDGTPSHSERKWAEENGWATREFTLTWETATALLDRGIPFTLATMGTGMGHLQAVIGYDERRQTLLLRDPYHRHVGEALMPELIGANRSSGPRAMAMVPKEQVALYDGIAFDDADLYDREYRLQTHLMAHRRDDAQAEFEAMSVAAPEHRLTLYARRALAAYDANLTEMLACADALIAEYPEDSNLHLFRLSLLRELSQRDERLKALEELTRWDSKDSKTEAEESTEAPKAETEAETSVEAEPSESNRRAAFDPIFWMQYAQELVADAREHSKALSLIRRTLLFQPTNGDALHLKAQIFWQQRRFEEALELYRVATCLSDKDERLAYAYFQAARYLKRTEEALTLLRGRYRRFGTRSSQPVRTLYHALYEIDRTTEGIDLLEEALKKRPDDTDLLTYAAARYSYLGKFGRAEELIQATDGKLSRVESLRVRADFVAARGNSAEALVLWQEILQAEPLAMDAHRAIAGILAGSEGTEAVHAHFEQVTNRFPHHFGLHQLWSEYIREPDFLAVRETVLDRLVEINPADAWVRRERAIFYVENNRLKEAMAEAKTAHQLEPHSTHVYSLRGQICAALQQLEEARASFREAVRLTADNEYAITHWIRLCDTTQQQRDALSFLRSELTRQTILGDGLLAYRRFASEVYTPEELLATLHESLQARPDLWHSWSATVNQLIETRRLDEALQFARLAVERFPLIPPLYLDLASVHEARGESAEEQAVLEQALTISATWSPAVRALCGAYERARQPEKAVELLTTTLKREPLNAENNWALAATLWRIGQREEALERLKMTLRVEPRYTAAWGLLDEWSRMLGKVGTVATAAREYVERAPREPLAHLTLARVLPNTEAYREERLSHLEEAIRLSPRLWSAYELKAEILAEAHRWDEAFAVCRPAGGGRVPAALLLAAARIEARRTGVSAAIQRLRTSLASEPQFYDGWYQLAEWNRAQGSAQARAYLEAAQKMSELRPQDAMAWGYLADARTRNNDRKGAKAALEYAFSVDWQYTYAGFTLMTMQFEDEEIEAARVTLDRLDGATHDPWVPAFGVRLAGKQNDMERAIYWLSRLVTLPKHLADDIRGPLDAALSIIREKSWQERIANLLHTMLRGTDFVRPEAAAAWVQMCIGESNGEGNRRDTTRRGGWAEVEANLPYLRANGEIGVEAMAAYIEALGEQERKNELNRSVRDHWDYLRLHSRTWASVGQSLLALDDDKLAADWCADWELREDLEPWMYMVPVACLRRLNRDAEAHRASQKALEHPLPDHSIARHATWLALDAALVGDLNEAVPLIERVGDSQDLPLFFQFLYGLALALIRVQQTNLGERKSAFNRAKEILAQTRTLLPDARENPVLTRFYAKTVRRIASDVGGPMAQLWAMTSASL
jgi:tetratricopeptide (TPR) repeat protein